MDSLYKFEVIFRRLGNIAISKILKPKISILFQIKVVVRVWNLLYMYIMYENYQMAWTVCTLYRNDIFVFISGTAINKRIIFASSSDAEILHLKLNWLQRSFQEIKEEFRPRYYVRTTTICMLHTLPGRPISRWNWSEIW